MGFSSIEIMHVQIIIEVSFKVDSSFQQCLKQQNIKVFVCLMILYYVYFH